MTSVAQMHATLTSASTSLADWRKSVEPIVANVEAIGPLHSQPPLVAKEYQDSADVVQLLKSTRQHAPIRPQDVVETLPPLSINAVAAANDALSRMHVTRVEEEEVIDSGVIEALLRNGPTYEAVPAPPVAADIDQQCSAKRAALEKALASRKGGRAVMYALRAATAHIAVNEIIGSAHPPYKCFVDGDAPATMGMRLTSVGRPIYELPACTRCSSAVLAWWSARAPRLLQEDPVRLAAVLGLDFQ